MTMRQSPSKYWGFLDIRIFCLIVFITATHIHVVGEFVVVDSHAIAQTYNVFTTYCHNIHILIIRHKGSDYISYRQNRGWMLTFKVRKTA